MTLSTPTPITGRLLRTKIMLPPYRERMIARARLVERLDDALNCPLTLICAAAGFGKTSLLVEWHTAHPEIPMAWLSLDEDDNEPSRVFMHLIGALDTISPGVLENFEALWQTTDTHTLRTVLTPLLNALGEISDEFVLVLDDYHFVSAPNVHQALAFMIEHMPSHMHLIVSSREDPPLPLGRLRARGQMVELRAHDLRFTPDEAATFLHTMLGVTLTTDEIAALDTRTEGWIAGLQLAALAMKGRKDVSGFIEAFSGSHRYILDYLADEVLHRQPETLQTFLVQTSILETLNAALCEAVARRQDSQELLETLEHANLFVVALDDRRHWYRYHHLFRDVLRNYLQRTQGEITSKLHANASRWFEAQGYLLEAVRHALAASETDRAAHLIEAQTIDMIGRGQWGTLKRLIDSLPTEVRRSRALLSIGVGWVNAIHRLQSGFVELADDAAQAIREDTTLTTTERKTLHAYTQSIYGYDRLYSLRFSEAAQLFEEALAHIPAENALARGMAWFGVATARRSTGDIPGAQQAFLEASAEGYSVRYPYIAIGGLVNCAHLMIYQGKLNQAHEILKQADHRIDSLRAHHTTVAAGVFFNYADLFYQRNRLTEAMQQIDHAQEILTPGDADHMIIQLLFRSAIIKTVLKQLDAAEADLQRIEPLIVDKPSFGVSYRVLRTHLALLRGQLAEAQRWRDVLNPDDPELVFENRYHTTMVTARVLLAEGKPDAALKLLDRLRTAAAENLRLYEYLTINALAYHAQGDLRKAVDFLADALELAAPEGIIRIFVDEGTRLETLLRHPSLLSEVEKRGISREFMVALLAAFAPSKSPQPLPLALRPAKPPLVDDERGEALSVRELEVLRLVAEGASNIEIAQQLYVTTGTVKKHISNIFIKLNAENRTQAVAIGRQLRYI